ncbi:hypothetical protein ACIOK4_00180 [Streptomyces bottropensis]|uniref:hypothetical protein n=1 Tax=Streptomyces bottropensis TaxID=42235 RepID=UPI0038087291
MKYALVTGIVRWSGGSMELTRGKSADDNHPLVIERPDLFGDQSPEADLAGPAPARDDQEETEAPAAPVVERATAAPGEKRTLGRASRRAAAPKGGTGE